MNKRKVTVAVFIAGFALFGIWVGYLYRYSIVGQRLFMNLFDGMPPREVEKVLELELKTLASLGNDEKYFDPGIRADNERIYGLEVTPKIKKRLRQRYSLIRTYNLLAGLEAKFFDNKLYGVDVYIVMKDKEQGVFRKQCSDVETEYKKQFPVWEKKSLEALNGGYGLSTESQSLHAFMMCDIVNQTITLSANVKDVFIKERRSQSAEHP
ncbi:hypothetical protein [Oligoflexus sp.]|uniref:hypothetical protein n=1 Tax=Oligoflexus sp. TaxID=1971216 RepID=UPI002D776ABD|nr:hypothetical protein [Oligoflexus sp.]